jgi:hypothetical protein
LSAFAIRSFLQLSVRWPEYDYRDFHPADVFLAHVFSIVAGLGRVENTQCLIHNRLIPPLLGLNEFPHRDTLRTFLVKRKLSARAPGRLLRMQQRQALLLGLSFNLYRLKHRYFSLRMSTEPNDF